MRRLLALLIAFVASTAHAQGKAPVIDDLLNLSSAGGARISPDAKWVAFSVTSTDWKADAFVGQIWIASLATGERRQLTRGAKASGNAEWSPDGGWISFTSAREDGKNQIYVIRPDGGEAQRITKSAVGVGGYEWSRDGKSIAFVADDSGSKAMKEREDKYGAFTVVRKDYTYTHLYTFDVAKALADPQAGRQRTSGHDFTVQQFDWSPDGRKIAFSATINADLIQGKTADIYVVTLATDSGATDDVRKIVSQPGPDNNPVWSPDGSQIAFSTTMGNEKYFASNTRIAVVPATGGTPRSLTDGFDENPGLLEWKASAIWFTGAQKTASHLFKLDPTSGRFQRVSGPDGGMFAGFSLSRDASKVAFTVSSPTALPEIAVSDVAAWAPKTVTAMTDQIRGWNVGTREMISWKSKDGATIEGILIKPANFDPSKKYPLLCVIHGGPTGTDRPSLIDSRTYPIDTWVARGAIVLKVNYRGSAGYGEAFRKLNIRNLGVGDEWDVLSGVDNLIKKGWVDTTKMASMGWSQGGYISAFLTTTTTRFAAISVGAGISDWATYYYNTDITPFTINYLGNDPAMDPAIYAKTSPITYVKGAKTPTLILQGELDRRVPIANGYELRQALEDRGVPVEMVVYKGFGHGITKPKSQRAVMEHNFAWFNHYLWGDPLPNLGFLSVRERQ
jgi:dipeptidyl aminopeptidase/acylaminoacyl peptidase